MQTNAGNKQKIQELQNDKLKIKINSNNNPYPSDDIQQKLASTPQVDFLFHCIN